MDLFSNLCSSLPCSSFKSPHNVFFYACKHFGLLTSIIERCSADKAVLQDKTFVCVCVCGRSGQIIERCVRHKLQAISLHPAAE